MPPRIDPWEPYHVPDTMGPGVSIALEEEGSTTRFAVDDASFYWISTALDTGGHSRVRSCQKVDCPSTIITYDEGADIAPGDADHDSLAAGGGSVAWTRTAGTMTSPVPMVTVLTCASEGCDGAPSVVSSNVTVNSLAVDDAYAYWTSTSDTAILRRSLAGSGSIEAIVVNEIRGAQLRVDGTHAYWLSSPRSANGIVKRAHKDGSTPADVIATEQNQVAWLALDSTYFYWANSYSSGTISRCPLSGCVDAPAVIVGGQNRPSSLVTDGKSIFWTAVVDVPTPSTVRAAVMRCPIDDCTSQTETLAVHTLPSTGTQMAVDASHVYWLVRQTISSDGGRIVRSTIYRHPK